MTHSHGDFGAHCIGTLVSGGLGADETEHWVCDQCGAYTHGDVEDMPTGTDRAANDAAWDAGEDCSPPVAGDCATIDDEE